MTQVALPAAFTERVLNLRYGIVNPAAITHRSPWTGASQTLARGVGSWAGSVEIHPVATASDAAAVAAVFEQLATDPGRWIELPHHEGAPDEPMTVDTYVGGILTVTTTAAADQRGRFVRASDGRSYRIRTDTVQGATRSITTLPARAWEVGDTLTPTLTIRAFPDEPGVVPDTYRDIDFRGPWALAWREIQ